MIMTVEELKQFINTEKPNPVLEVMLQAQESFIVNFTNNNFINRKTGNVEFPPDVKMGVVKLIQYDLNCADKVGISSETISRHSVSYEVQTGEESEGGYPKNLTTFLKPYMKARF